MAKSGMRYQGVLNLINEIDEKKQRISELMNMIQNDRTSQVAKVYGGSAAENFKTNAQKIASAVDENIASIIKQLNEEAQTQHDNYQKQEAALQQSVNI